MNTGDRAPLHFCPHHFSSLPLKCAVVGRKFLWIYQKTSRRVALRLSGRRLVIHYWTDWACWSRTSRHLESILSVVSLLSQLYRLQLRSPFLRSLGHWKLVLDHGTSSWNGGGKPSLSSVHSDVCTTSPCVWPGYSQVPYTSLQLLLHFW